MSDFVKLASFLDSFKKEDPGYDAACFIKAKIAEDFADKQTINNGEETSLDNNDITMSTPEQQSAQNIEGQEMAGAFQEFDALNDIKEKKEDIGQDADKLKLNGLEMASQQAFGDNPLNQKHASVYELLKRKLKL
jgi:hypothetical protein